VLVVDETLWPLLEDLPWLEPDGLERLFATSEVGAAGRDPTARIEVPGASDSVVLRRLLHGGLLGPLLGGAFLGLGRPLRELTVTATLRRAGAPVPRPALVVGRRLWGPLWRSAVGTLHEPDTVDALAFLQDRPEPARVLRVCAAVGRAVRRFHDAGGRHADLHVKNLLVRECDDAVQAVVIDLDKARVTPGLTPGERMSQIMRLFRSLLKRGVFPSVGPRGCARFFGAYCGDDRLLRRALWSRVDRELRVVALHSWHYRAPDGGRA
jgi:3-deoxy-D-manno-octulosonic acid kinase